MEKEAKGKKEIGGEIMFGNYHFFVLNNVWIFGLEFILA